jgi:hypothetical protein
VTISDYVDKIPQTEKRIHEICERWMEPLGLRWFRKFNVVYDATPKETSREVVGDCRVSWEYLEATVTFYLPSCVDLSDDDLEYAIVHEFMHALVKEMRWQDDEDGKDRDNMRHEERVCTQLAMAE